MQAITLKFSRLAKGTDVADLRVLGPLEHEHVVDHAMTQRRSLASEGHQIPVDERGNLLRSLTSRAAASTHHHRPGRNA